jgi:hypothetical protein
VPLVDELLQSKHREAILIACKAAELEWPTVKAVLNCRAIAGKMSDLDVDTARADFLRLSASGAQRVLRFWQVRHAVAKPPPPTARIPDDGPPNARSEQR